MKKATRIFIVSMAILFIAGAVPFGVLADDNTGSLPILLDIPNLETTVEAGDYTFTASNLTINKATIREGSVVKGGVTAASGDMWYGYVGQTNIPLTNDSHFVITFTAQYYEPITMMGFTFLRFNNSNKGAAIRDQALSVFFDQRPANAFPYIYLESNWAGYNANTGVKYDEAGITAEQLYQENDFVIAIDGTDIRLYMNQAFLGEFSCENWMQYSPVLAMGTCLLSRSGGTEGGQIADIRNMKLYNGSYELYDNLGAIPSVMNVANLATVIETGDYTLAGSGLKPSVTTELDGSLVKAGSAGNNWYGYVGITNIPITEESKYVISYTAQYNSIIDIPGFAFLRYTNGTKTAIRDTVLSVYFDQRSKNSYDYMYVRANWINADATCVRYTTAGIASSQLYGENDFVIAVEDAKATVYMNHEFLGTFSLADWMDKSPILALGTSIHPSGSTTAGQELATIQNIRVFNGSYELYKTVTFEQNGAAIGSRTCTVGKTVGNLPSASLEDDEVAVWYVKDTDTVIDATMNVMKETTLEARVFKKSASEIKGVQVTEVSEGKQGIRFIAILQSLEGSRAGFEVTAKYQSDDAVVTGSPFIIKTNYVYSSVTAASGGVSTSVSANDLGGNYLIAIGIDDVPADTRVDFSVRSYVEYGGESVYGEAVVVKLNNGAVDNSLEALG